MELFKSLNEEGQTIIMVTHNPENIEFSTRTIFLRDGRVDGKGWKAEPGPSAFSELS
jgi:putative ABC transport system ATP-binding protein